MKFIQKFKGLLFKRSLFSLGILFLIRMGTFLPVPGINQDEVSLYLETHSVAKNLISTFSGQNSFVIGLFTLNIFPYINATISTQLIVGFSPRLAKLQKNGDFQSRRAISRITRQLTIGFAILQSFGIASFLRQVLYNWNSILAVEIIIWLTAGAMIVLWLSELITGYGLGTGTSLLLYINIISNLPNLIKKFITENTGNFTFFLIIIIGLVTLASFCGIVYLQESVRKVPLISSKQLNQRSQTNSVNMYLPLRLNQAGVMPIILTTAFLVLPNYIVNLRIFQWLNFLTYFKFIYWIGYFVLILLSSCFYSYIILNPKDISDQLQTSAVTIPGLRPGSETTFYLKQTIMRVTLLGATILAILTMVPTFVESTLKITGLSGLSTTSFLILAGVILDLIREIENLYYSNAYDYDDMSEQ